MMNSTGIGDSETGRLIRKYRKEKGWTISEDPKRGISILQVIREHFGRKASPRLLKKETFKNFESQGSHHVEPTAIELYQIAQVLEVPLLALLIDYDTPCNTSPFDDSKSIFEAATQEGDTTRDFRGFDEIREAEAEARQFVKKVKKLSKLPCEQIKEKLVKDNYINTNFWPRLYTKATFLPAEGVDVTPKTYAYYEEAKTILAKAGVHVTFIFSQDLCMIPWFKTIGKEEQLLRKEESEANFKWENIQNSIDIYKDRDDPLSQLTVKYLRESQEEIAEEFTQRW